MAADLNELKKNMFYDLLNLAGRVFILINYAEDVIIGSRGFLPAEKEKGLVLVFNNKMNFTWDDAGLSAKLVFGSTPERCFIPNEAIVSVFSPELSAQFSVSPAEKEPAEQRPDREAKEKPSADAKVVKVDFRKRK
ncbi:MAG: hypothetical protein HZA17_14905 [Nitrospirae bacterium]|nr:hypothetical protein [Nitrospirota bacterium]